MCRLYGFRSNNPRKVECELIRAQNALIVQSLHDEKGMSNPHGWGLGTYNHNKACVERQARPAYEDDYFRWAAARIFSCNVLAHVRHATIGKPRLVNTHPFQYDNWLLAHNGTIAAFSKIRSNMMSAMTPQQGAAISGETDSEHLFHFLLSLKERNPNVPMLEIIREGLQQIIIWSKNFDAKAEVAVNILLTDGETIYASRYGRSL